MRPQISIDQWGVRRNRGSGEVPLQINTRTQVILFCHMITMSVGHVGAPLPCNLIKLVDVPEKECYAKDGKGEVY